MKLNDAQFGPEVLLLFIGHSSDADEEARAIVSLERELLRELEHLQRVADHALPFKSVHCWQWNCDAPPLVGGQEAAISPYLDRANMALFVFKERIGEVTWTELERARRREDPSIPIAAFFPANPPESARMSDLVVAEGWTNLLRKRRSLSADWTAVNSRSLRPTTSYEDIQHLKDIVLEQMKNGLGLILQSSWSKVARGVTSRQWPAFLGEAGHLSYDGRPVLRHTLEQLDFASVRRFLERQLTVEQLEQLGFTDADPSYRIPEKLRALGCACDGRPSLGTFLCFAPAALVADQVDACGLQLVVYDRAQRAPSSPSIFIVRGNLLTLYAEGLAWLKNRAGLTRRGHIGTADRDELEIPEIVLREALANALVHRDYETEQLRDQPTRVEVFPDRVEITSFGALPTVVPIESLNEGSENPVAWRRNPVIARIFQSLSLAELNASGVSRMRLEMEKASLAFPRFVTKLHDNVVRVVLLRPARPPAAEVIVASRRTRQRGQPSALISRTIADLPDHRQVIMEACTALGVFPMGWEPAGATVDDRMVTDAVSQADIFIGVYGRRYGEILNGSGKSATELEYDTARKRGIAMLLFIMDDEHPITRAMLENDEGAAEKLDTFKARLREHHLIRTFRSPAELAGTLVQSLAEVLHQSENARELDQGDDEHRAQPPELCALPPYIGSHQFVGREAEIEVLDTWANPKSPYPVMLIDAIGGSGKSMLSWQWLTQRATHARQDWAGRLWYSFYEAGGDARDLCVRAIAYMTGESDQELRRRNTMDLHHQLFGLLRSKPWLLVLDGLERLLVAYQRLDSSDSSHDLSPDDAARETDEALLRNLTQDMPSKVLISSRLVPRPLLNTSGQLTPGVTRLTLSGLQPTDAETLMRATGVHGDSNIIRRYVIEHCDCHPLLVASIAGLVNDYLPARRDFAAWASDPNAGGQPEFVKLPLVNKRNQILKAALTSLPKEHKRLLSTIALISGTIDYETLAALFQSPPTDEAATSRNTAGSLPTVVRDLERRGLLNYDTLAKRYGLHPIVRASVLSFWTAARA